MSKVRTDFYFTYSSEKLKAARERLRISQGETARRAQICGRTYNGYERGAIKTISGSNACKVALALRCEVSELFDNYEAARLHFSSREARKLTEEDRRSYAENHIGLVRFFVNSYLSLWDGDFDEGFSEALEVFFKALVDFRKPEKEEETETALRALSLIHISTARQPDGQTATSRGRPVYKPRKATTSSRAAATAAERSGESNDTQKKKAQHAASQGLLRGPTARPKVL